MRESLDKWRKTAVKEETFHQLFEQMAEGVAYCRMLFDGAQGLDWIYLSVNGAFEKLTGLKDVVGKRVTEVIPGLRETDPGLFEAYARVSKTKNPEKFELYVGALDEWFSVSLYSPQTGFFVSIFDNITERKRAEENLRKKSAEIEGFTYMVSHDLKSPLVTIKTFLGFLEMDLKANKAESASRDLAYIRGAADKMERLLDELLEFVRIGHTRSVPEAAPLQEVAKEALELLAGQIVSKGVSVDVTAEPVWLYGDRPRLVEIFQNLVENAVKFMGDQPAPRIEIGAEQENGEIVLFVRDNGKGIDPLHAPKLFGLFEKLDTDTPGSGIGLATVRRIVEVHGGKIRVQSDGPGKGTTFRFTLEKTERRRAG